MHDSLIILFCFSKSFVNRMQCTINRQKHHSKCFFFLSLSWLARKRAFLWISRSDNDAFFTPLSSPWSWFSSPRVENFHCLHRKIHPTLGIYILSDNFLLLLLQFISLTRDSITMTCVEWKVNIQLFAVFWRMKDEKVLFIFHVTMTISAWELKNSVFMFTVNALFRKMATYVH